MKEENFLFCFLIVVLVLLVGCENVKVPITITLKPNLPIEMNVSPKTLENTYANLAVELPDGNDLWDVKTKGYYFHGWATSSTGSAEYKAGDSFTTSTTATLYAVWGDKPISPYNYSALTIKYDLNGADEKSGVPETKSYELELSSNGTSYYSSWNSASREGITKEGYYLYSWNEMKDGSGRDVFPCALYGWGPDIFKTINDKGEVTLYAQWIKADEIDGIFYRDEDGGTYSVLGLSNTNNATEVTIPSTANGKTVTAIYKYAFCNKENITKITLPDTLISIEERAFEFCSSLKDINLPSSLTKIGSFAFFQCWSIKSLTIPGNVKVLEKACIDQCTNLSSVTIENGVEEIEDSVFFNCTHLTSIEIPNSVKIIDKGAFEGCSNLTSIKINNAEGSISNAPWGAENATVTWSNSES